MKSREEILKKYNNEDRMFLAQVLDKAILCEKRSYITNTKFLDLRERSLVSTLLKQCAINNYVVYGGYDDAERSVVIFYPDYYTQEDAVQNSPLSAIRATKSDLDTIGHRDYLGALMGLGIKREYIGDIIVTDKGADIIILEEMRDYILLNFNRAGKRRIELNAVNIDHLFTVQQDGEVKDISVASLRLDAIVSVAFNLSRSNIKEFIDKGLVFLNFQQCFKGEKELDLNDKVTVRGKGKLEICEVLGKSRKGRQFIKIRINC